ncbi:ABC transporter substrate-binding protein [Oceanobacillus profundus]|uniref:Carbohydrate ABC transporter substrate-binding protein n=1 Tax=Oceanobacillus profundus TaxID=372463 RepID=A0A417YHH3_9BACI|nr:ABC transporter substrate-binding protein [Oceanobacillus profundus]MCM3398188.1 ABC transporter substrate-binding protein [Oceanobacillus profundus]PAE29255.1 sugar transporter [Paenibacillus sp. 7884-2]RHW32335.1 carbohydrate ABC transporter substrate-binding protein [Oceanobacillus profundus]
MKGIRKIAVLGLATLLAFLLAACSGSDDGDTNDASGEKGEITLDFWTFGATGYEELAKEYEKENPNIKIKVKSSETADHHDALFTSLSAGSGAPDIAMLEIDQFDRFKVAQDRFENLYNLGANDVKDQYLEWKWQSGENVDGDFLFGLPTDIGPKALYYRTDLFEQAGLPTDPEEVAALIDSPEAFEEVGLQVTEETGMPFVDSIEMAFRAYLDAAETAYLTPENELNLGGDSEVKKAYDYAVHLNDLGLVGKYEMWSPEWANAVNKGEFAAELGAGWLKGWMEGNAPEAVGKWNVATLPTEFAANWGGSYIAVPSETEYAQEAYDFIEWLVSSENQLKSFQSHGLFPSAQAVYEEEAFKTNEDEFFGGQATAPVFAEAAQDITGIGYKGEKYFPVHNEILNALKNVQNKGADPEKEWDAAVKRAEDLMKR